MKPSENPPTQRDPQPPAIPPGSSTTANSILQFTALLVVTALVFWVSVGPHVLAKTGHQANSQGNSNIDPDAMEALNKMGTYLRSLKAFQIDSEVTNDEVLDDGEIITDNRTNTLLAVSPNLLRAELKSDEKDVFLFYDVPAAGWVKASDHPIG
jgi:hypothetical protein